MSEPTPRSAREALGVAEDASKEVLHASFLRMLRDCHYVPPPLTVEAMAALGELETVNTTRSHLQRRIATALASDIERFANDYWNLPPVQRREEWKRLATVVKSFPRLRAQVDELATGLDIVPPILGDDVSAQLVATIVRQYPLPTAQQNLIWHEFIRAHEKNKRLKKVAKQLQSTHPTLFALAVSRIKLDIFQSQSTGFKWFGGPKRGGAKRQSKLKAAWNSPPMIIALVIIFSVSIAVVRNGNHTPTPTTAPTKFIPKQNTSTYGARHSTIVLGLKRLQVDGNASPSLRDEARLVATKMEDPNQLSLGEKQFIDWAEGSHFSPTPRLEEIASDLAKQRQK
jgi:hypothetical protein